MKGRGKKRRVHEGMGRHGAWRRREKKGREREKRERRSKIGEKERGLTCICRVDHSKSSG